MEEIKLPRGTRGEAPHNVNAMLAIAAYLAHSPRKAGIAVSKDKLWAGVGVTLVLSLLLNVYHSANPKAGLVYPGCQSTTHCSPLIVTSAPFNTLPNVEQWVGDSLVRSFTLDFSRYKEQLASVREDYTDGGWQGFMKAVKENGFLDAVVSNRYIVSSVTTGPVVLSKMPEPHATSWTFQVPLLITFSIGSTRQSQSHLVEITVVRQSGLRNPKGRGIDSIKFL